MPRVFAAPEVMASSAIKKDIGKIRDSLNAMFYPEVKPKGPISLPTQEEVNRINFQIVTVSKNSRSFENVASAERSEEVKTAREDLYKLVNKIQQEFYGGKVNKYDLGSLKNIESDSKEEIKNVMQENADKVAREMNLGVPERYTYSKRILGQAFSQLSQTEDAPLLAVKDLKSAERSEDVSSGSQESQVSNGAVAVQNAGACERAANLPKKQSEESRVNPSANPATEKVEYTLREVPPNYWKRVIGGVVLAAGAASALFDDKIGMYVRNAVPIVPQGITFKTIEELGVGLAAAGVALYMSAKRKPILAVKTISGVSEDGPAVAAVKETAPLLPKDSSGYNHQKVTEAGTGLPSRAKRKRLQRKKSLHGWINKSIAIGAIAATLIAVTGDRNARHVSMPAQTSATLQADQTGASGNVSLKATERYTVVMPSGPKAVTIKQDNGQTNKPAVATTPKVQINEDMNATPIAPAKYTASPAPKAKQQQENANTKTVSQEAVVPLTAITSQTAASMNKDQLLAADGEIAMEETAVPGFNNPNATFTPAQQQTLEALNKKDVIIQRALNNRGINYEEAGNIAFLLADGARAVIETEETPGHGSLNQVPTASELHYLAIFDRQISSAAVKLKEDGIGYAESNAIFSALAKVKR